MNLGQTRLQRNALWFHIKLEKGGEKSRSGSLRDVGSLSQCGGRMEKLRVRILPFRLLASVRHRTHRMRMSNRRLHVSQVRFKEEWFMYLQCLPRGSDLARDSSGLSGVLKLGGCAGGFRLSTGLGYGSLGAGYCGFIDFQFRHALQFPIGCLINSRRSHHPGDVRMALAHVDHSGFILGKQRSWVSTMQMESCIIQ